MVNNRTSTQPLGGYGKIGIEATSYSHDSGYTVAVDDARQPYWAMVNNRTSGAVARSPPTSAQPPTDGYGK